MFKMYKEEDIYHYAIFCADGIHSLPLLKLKLDSKNSVKITIKIRLKKINSS